jgi:hypothetical protein
LFLLVGIFSEGDLERLGVSPRLRGEVLQPELFEARFQKLAACRSAGPKDHRATGGNYVRSHRQGISVVSEVALAAFRAAVLSSERRTIWQ